MPSQGSGLPPRSGLRRSGLPRTALPRAFRNPGAFLEAPAAFSISAIWSWRRFTAQASGVAHGSSSGRLVGAPRASRNSTMSGRSLRAAHPSGVERYSSSFAEIVAPASSRMFAHSTRVGRGRPRPSRPHRSCSGVARCQFGQVRVHSARQQQTEDLRVFQQVGTTVPSRPAGLARRRSIAAPRDRVCPASLQR